MQIHYHNTDSLIIKIITKNIYKDMLKDADWFDTSEYPENHICYSEKNKKVLYKFKDENNGKLMQEHCALKPKMYCNTATDTQTPNKKEQEKTEKEKEEVIELYKNLGENFVELECESAKHKDSKVQDSKF